MPDPGAVRDCRGLTFGYAEVRRDFAALPQNSRMPHRPDYKNSLSHLLRKCQLPRGGSLRPIRPQRGV